MARLRDEEVAAALGRLAGWQQVAGGIRRIYELADFDAAMRFVHRVADLARAARHHPEISVRGRRVTLTLTTHEESGVTGKDIELARRIDA
ncbi:MAG: 4a-hydroxytetrahydrobiopterin dehydratase [Planctomycetota bacterium]|jgi:4a-hydroxytetrahydrobiopterin dehydratase